VAHEQTHVLAPNIQDRDGWVLCVVCSASCLRGILMRKNGLYKIKRGGAYNKNLAANFLVNHKIATLFSSFSEPQK
jgi:hypothetical protein